MSSANTSSKAISSTSITANSSPPVKAPARKRTPRSRSTISSWLSAQGSSSNGGHAVFLGVARTRMALRSRCVHVPSTSKSKLGIRRLGSESAPNVSPVPISVDASVPAVMATSSSRTRPASPIQILVVVSLGGTARRSRTVARIVVHRFGASCRSSRTVPNLVTDSTLTRNGKDAYAGSAQPSGLDADGTTQGRYPPRANRPGCVNPRERENVHEAALLIAALTASVAAIVIPSASASTRVLPLSAHPNGWTYDQWNAIWARRSLQRDWRSLHSLARD